MRKHLKKINSTSVVVATIFTILTCAISFYYYIVAWRTKDLNGHWKFTFDIKESTYTPYIGKSSGFRIFLTQNNCEVKRKGEMCWVNDKEIPYSQHVKLECDGKVDGDKLLLHFTQFGALRQTDGQLVAEIKEISKVEGTFYSTGANTKGISIGEK